MKSKRSVAIESRMASLQGSFENYFKISFRWLLSIIGPHLYNTALSSIGCCSNIYGVVPNNIE